MSKRDKGMPAFPVQCPDLSPYGDGMSLLDYFAAQALPNCLSHVRNEIAQYHPGPDGRLKDFVIPAAELAYRVADAMLKEREK